MGNVQKLAWTQFVFSNAMFHMCYTCEFFAWSTTVTGLQEISVKVPLFLIKPVPQTALLPKFHKDGKTKMDVINQQDFMIFEFQTDFCITER